MSFEKQVRTVSLKHLLFLYLVIPVMCLAVWLDQNVFGMKLLFALPFKPEAWIWWIYVFGMPHVMASMNTLVDREYLAFYKWKLAYVFAGFLALPIALSWLAGPQAVFAVFAAMIVYHTIAQQFGIAVVAMRKKPGYLYGLWKWCAVGAAISLYSMIYTAPVPLVFLTQSPLRDFLTLTAEVLIAVHVIAGAALAWGARGNRMGVVHIIANTMMVSAEFYFFSEGYFTLVIVLARIIHEFTAWHIYATHDSNRARTGPHNMIFRALAFTRLPVYLLTIAVAFLVGVTLTYGVYRFEVAGSLLISLSLIHYWMEGFLWKGGSIHRKSLAFSS